MGCVCPVYNGIGGCLVHRLVLSENQREQCRSSVDFFDAFNAVGQPKKIKGKQYGGPVSQSIESIGPGTELTRIFMQMGFPGCNACGSLAAKMNQWGVEGCKNRVDEIVADILPRAKEWWNKASAKMLLSKWFTEQISIKEKLSQLRQVASGDVDSVLRESVKIHVLAAIASAELNQSTSVKSISQTQIVSSEPPSIGAM